MNFFKRRTHRTTLTISDQTKESRASLSSGDGKASHLGSTSTLRKHEASLTGSENGPDKYHSTETVIIGENDLIKGSAKLPRKKSRHAHFLDNENESNNNSNIPGGQGPQEHNRNVEHANPLVLTEKPKEMTLLQNPGPNLVQNLTPENPRPPMSLYHSIINGNKAELKKVVSANPDLLDTADNFGRTPLMYCVLADQLECAKYLIKRGCELDQVDNAGRTAIHSAAHKGSYKFLELLKNRGALIDLKDNDGQTALHLATRNRNAKCLEFLLRHVGAGMVDVPDNQMRTALHWSAAFNNAECVKLLIKYGINIAIPDSDGKTPLHWAANNHDPTAVHTMAALLEKSPGVVNWQDYEGRTALHFAVAYGNSAAVGFLVRFEQQEYFEPYKCDLDRSDNTFRTALHWAAQLGHDHIVKSLLDAGAKHSCSDSNGATPFLYAALNNNHKVIETMIAHDKSVLEQTDIEGRTVLMWAAGKGANDVIRVILGIHKKNEEEVKDSEQNGEPEINERQNEPDKESRKSFSSIDINKVDNKANTALHVAALNGHGSSVELLLSQGARHDLQNHLNHTPIFGACEKGHLNVVKYLLDYNASINLVDSECRSPLHMAALGGHAEVCELLIKEGLDVDVRDRLEQTPLHYAAFGAFINCMNLLLENGANVDLQDQEGRSALHWAAQTEYLDATKLLFQYAVFPNSMEYTEERLTPLDLALQKEREEVAQYLLEQGALSAENIRNIAATKIQACFRGYQVRKTFLTRKHLLMKMLMLRKDKTRGKKRSEGQVSDDGGRKAKVDSLSPLTAQSHMGPSSNITSDVTEDEEHKETVIEMNSENEEKTNTGVESPSVTKKTPEETSSGLNLGGEVPHNQSIEEATGSDPSEETIRAASLSVDEGIICDRVSVASSSHSSVKSDKGAEELLDSNPTNDKDADSQSSNEKLHKEPLDLEKPADVEQVHDPRSSEENTTPQNIVANTASPIPDESMRKREKKLKSKKDRSKNLRRVLDSDSDIPKNTSSVLESESSSLSMRSLSSFSKKTTSSELRLVPAPPATRNKHPRKKRLPVPPNRIPTSPAYVTQLEPDLYPALDQIGDEDNIKSDKVSGIAYRTPPMRSSLYAYKLKAAKSPPAILTSASLDLSEYIESLMNLSKEEQRVLRNHQRCRREAFRTAHAAAQVIQRCWWKYLARIDPELRRKFKHARKRALKLEERTRRKAESSSEKIQKDEKKQRNNIRDASASDFSDKMHKTRRMKQSKVEPVVANDSATTLPSIQAVSDPKPTNPSISSSDQMSNSESDRSGRTKHPKKMGFGKTSMYVSVDKLEELSRIYGHPQAFRQFLMDAGKTSGFPMIDQHARSSGTRVRPVTVAGGNRRKPPSENSDKGSDAMPAISPRQWASTSSNNPRQVPKSSSRVQSRYRAGPPGSFPMSRPAQGVDVSRLPLQWQKLYGELQNMAEADSIRKNSARFSYNLGDVGL